MKNNGWILTLHTLINYISSEMIDLFLYRKPDISSKWQKRQNHSHFRSSWEIGWRYLCVRFLQLRPENKRNNYIINTFFYTILTVFQQNILCYN